jgi:hypothetical protein
MTCIDSGIRGRCSRSCNVGGCPCIGERSKKGGARGRDKTKEPKDAMTCEVDATGWEGY